MKVKITPGVSSAILDLVAIVDHVSEAEMNDFIEQLLDNDLDFEKGYRVIPLGPESFRNLLWPRIIASGHPAAIAMRVKERLLDAGVPEELFDGGSYPIPLGS